MPQDIRAPVNDWDELCSALGPWESEHLTRDEIDLALREHFRRVNDLLSTGHHLRQTIEKEDFQDKALLEHINARIRHLEDKLALWHREMDRSAQERILAAAFE